MRERFITWTACICMLTFAQLGHADEPRPIFPELKSELLTFSSKQDKVKISLGGRMQVDGALFFGEDIQPIGNGVGFRRVRLYTNVSIGKQLSGKIELDLTDGSFSLKDCFVRYNLKNGLYFRAGNFKESFGMDAMTSSGDLFFMEKANISSAFHPEFHLGVQATWQKKQFLGAAGVHFREIGGSKEKSNAEVNNKEGVDEGVSYTARGVWMPQSTDEQKGIHLGAAASYRTPKTTTSSSANTAKYSTRSLSAINKIKFLDTGTIADVNHDWLLGVELGAFYKAFRMQGEYNVNRTSRLQDLPTETFDGYYLQAAYLLFGGQQKYSRSRGAFSEPTLGQGWGDVELAARFDRLDLNGNLIEGGRSNGWTLGATYYANKNLKLQVNYSYINHDRYANAAGTALVGVTADGKPTSDSKAVVGKGGNDYSTLALRIQFEF